MNFFRSSRWIADAAQNVRAYNSIKGLIRNAAHVLSVADDALFDRNVRVLLFDVCSMLLEKGIQFKCCQLKSAGVVGKIAARSRTDFKYFEDLASPLLLLQIRLHLLEEDAPDVMIRPREKQVLGYGKDEPVVQLTDPPIVAGEQDDGKGENRHKNWEETGTRVEQFPEAHVSRSERFESEKRKVLPKI